MTTRVRRPTQRGSWDECSLLPGHLGVRWWAAVGCSLALIVIGVFADLARLSKLGVVFQACYFLGCLLAVTVVQRKDLFVPMVQPPLILAVAVPGVVLAAGSLPTGGVVATALAVGTPLINGFPTMAITTGLTLAIGTCRLIIQRPRATEDP